MSRRQLDALAKSIVLAIDELKAMISTHYPNAQFEVAHAVDEAENVHLTVTVDIDDPEELLDLVMDRLLEFQIEERIPIHVIPLRPVERVLAATHPSVAHLPALPGNSV
jgi:hypothetical protein